MRRRPGFRGRDAGPLLPIVFTVLCVAFCAFGGHLVWHASRATWALAHDPTCSRELPMSAPAAGGDVCRVVRGTVVRAYKVERSTKHGYVYDRHFVFAPQSGPAVDFDVAYDEDGVYDRTHRAPGGPAVIEYVDGEVDYVTDEFGTIGPNFDPDDGKVAGWFLVGLGVFFAVMVLFIAVVNKRTDAARRAREARIATYLDGGRPDVSPRATRLARISAGRKR